MADLNKLTESNQSNPQSGLVNSGNTIKKELVEGLLEENLECPYPNHEGYSKVRNTLPPDQQKEIKKNIRITDDGKIEIIPMKKKFSMLTAQHNGKDVFDGSHTDKNGKTGIKGVTYLTGRAAEREVDNQGKKLLKDIMEVEQFINYFPGENTKEKIFNFTKIFGFKKTGYWNISKKSCDAIGIIGYVRLARIGGFAYGYEKDGISCNANIYRDHRRFPTPFLAYESLG